MRVLEFCKRFFGYYTPSDLLVLLVGTELVVVYHDVVGVGLLGWTLLTIIQITSKITKRKGGTK